MKELWMTIKNSKLNWFWFASKRINASLLLCTLIMPIHWALVYIGFGKKDFRNRCKCNTIECVVSMAPLGFHNNTANSYTVYLSKKFISDKIDLHWDLIKVGTEWTASRLTPRPMWRGRRVAAFVVGAAYLARVSLKLVPGYIVLEFTTPPPAISLCKSISIHVWDFQRATTI